MTYRRARATTPAGHPTLRAVRTVVFYVPLAVFLLVTFAPVYWIILSAFTPINELFSTPLRYIPAHPSLINFQTVAGIVPLGQQAFNSVFLAFFSALFSVVVCLLAAYAFARIRFPGSGLLLI